MESYIVTRQADGGDDRGSDDDVAGEPILRPAVLLFACDCSLHFAHVPPFSAERSPEALGESRPWKMSEGR